MCYASPPTLKNLRTMWIWSPPLFWLSFFFDELDVRLKKLSNFSLTVRLPSSRQEKLRDWRGSEMSAERPCVKQRLGQIMTGEWERTNEEREGNRHFPRVVPSNFSALVARMITTFRPTSISSIVWDHSAYINVKNCSLYTVFCIYIYLLFYYQFWGDINYFVVLYVIIAIGKMNTRLRHQARTYIHNVMLSVSVCLSVSHKSVL